MSEPKILVITTPIRPFPTEFPPVGSLSVITYLKKSGINNVEFYDIDNNRPTYDEALAEIVRRSPDILGISAVVSTAYAYVKQLSLDVKRLLPNTLILVGGNLSASAEILLRRASVDFCVLGEGEVVFKNFVDVAKSTRQKEAFRTVKGLVFLDDQGGLINTGYEDQLPNHQVYDYDWNILAESSNIDHFFPVSDESPAWSYYYRVREAEGEEISVIPKDKRVATIIGSKGCVSRCTFCHRWDKGIRYIPPDVLIERVRYVIEKYNVGYICFGEENFGTDRKWLTELCQKIKPLNLRWRVGGMRVNSLTPEIIDMMKDAGCVTIICGMETGSEKMLQIMEKKIKLHDNFNAMKWIIERGLYTGVQLVIGMPGETHETIRETIEFTKYANALSKYQNPNALSINYAQALPGTPLYEYARWKGLIGQSLEEEEKYLLAVSNKNASGAFDTLNFTEYPKLLCETWQPLIQIETNYTYIQKFGLNHYYDIILDTAERYSKQKHESSYFQEPLKSMEKMAVDSVESTFSKESKLVLRAASKRKGFLSIVHLVRKNKWRYVTILHPLFAYRVRRLLPLICLVRSWKQKGNRYALQNLRDYVLFYLKSWIRMPHFSLPYKSLRKIVSVDLGALNDDPAMAPLRQGR